MNKILLLLSSGLIALLASPAFADQTKSSDKQAAKGEKDPLVMTVTTVTVAESTGCWAKIYDGYNFTGRELTLMGDNSVPNLEFPSGDDWEGDIDSVAVGPNARLALYEDENYRDLKRELKAGEKVADLHKTLVTEGVESMKITCTDGTNRNQNQNQAEL